MSMSSTGRASLFSAPAKPRRDRQAAAIANAIAHATGTRFRDLPITAEKVRAALA